MDDKTKEYLPAEVKKFTPAVLERLSEIAIPPQFKGTTSLAEVQNARKEYENENAGDTLAELHGKYGKCIDRILWERMRTYEKTGVYPDAEQATAEPKDPKALAEQKRSLQLALGRNSLEEYRKEKGLDELRENLKKKLVENVSFERGLSNLLRYCEENRGRVPLKPIMIPADIAGMKAPPEVKVLNSIYPNLTADEVSWLSLAELPKDWCYNHPAQVYYPHALVDIDMDGIMFAMGTIDDRLESGMEATNPLQVGGITGASPQYQLVPFNHNVSQLIKALVLLSLDDKDLFSGVWAGQDTVPLQRGDSMLLKSFLKNRPEQYKLPENFDTATLESIVSDGKVKEQDINACRDAITRYYSGLQLKGMPIHWVLDFIKLMGILSRLPKFVEKEEFFRGYAKLYGSGIDFITEDGQIADSVPLAEHLQHNVSYAFHNHLESASKKNIVMQELLKELQARVSEANSGKNQLAIDTVQAGIFGRHGVFVPTGVDSCKHRYDATEVLLSHSTDGELIQRTVKFSYDEVCMIRDVLDDLPEGAARHVRSIFKEISDAETIGTFRTGRIRGGCYDPVRKRVVISLPIESPLKRSGEALLMADITSGKKEREDIIEEMHNVRYHEAYFKHVFLHETGESIWHNLSEKVKNEWAAISSSHNDKAGKTDKVRKTFLTPYSRESLKEDFCECFAIYYLRGGEFRERTKNAPALQAKYEFMKRVWSADRQREFKNKSAIPLRTMHGNPEDDMKKLTIEEMIADAARSDEFAQIERVLFANTALSYEELAENAEKDGVSSAGELEKTARKHDASEATEAIDEAMRGGRIREFVRAKTEQEVYRLKVGADELFVTGLQDILCKGQREEAVDCLLKQGAKKRRAETTVECLLKLYKYFEEYLAVPEMTAKKEMQTRKKIIGFTNGILEWEKQGELRRTGNLPEEQAGQP